MSSSGTNCGLSNGDINRTTTIRLLLLRQESGSAPTRRTGRPTGARQGAPAAAHQDKSWHAQILKEHMEKHLGSNGPPSLIQSLQPQLRGSGTNAALRSPQARPAASHGDADQGPQEDPR